MVFDVLETRVFYRLALYKILAIYRGAIYVYCNNLLAKQAAEVIISKPPEAEISLHTMDTVPAPVADSAKDFATLAFTYLVLVWSI